MLKQEMVNMLGHLYTVYPRNHLYNSRHTSDFIHTEVIQTMPTQIQVFCRSAVSLLTAVFISFENYIHQIYSTQFSVRIVGH